MKNRKMSQNSQCVQIGFVASADISRLSFVTISVTSLAMEEGAEENAINNHTEALSAPVTFSREGYPLACNPMVGMSHDTPSPQQLSRMSIPSTPAWQVCPAGPFRLVKLFTGWGFAIRRSGLTGWAAVKRG